MLCISAAYAVMQCLSVCLSVMFVDHVKSNKRIFKIFSPSGSQATLVLRTKRHNQSDGNPPNWGVECKGVLKMIFRPISSFISEIMQDKVIVTMEGEYETETKLSNGTSLNDLE